MPRVRPPASPIASLPLLALLAGCGGTDCEKPWYLDRDGDGWGDRADPISACAAPEERVDRPGDCDDRDPAVNPGRSDGCNGVDDDCDGTVDPEATAWYADADGDGFGNTGLILRSCEAPDGFVAGGADCDDDDGRAYPGAKERCNGQDDDCDQLVDEGAPGDVRWYPDEDQDGWGDDKRGEELCQGPQGWTTVGGDCDDTSWTSSPGRPEVCDGRDNDCDDLEDADDASVQDAFLAWPDNDRDGYGDPSLAPLLACNARAGEAPNALDCDDGDVDRRPDAQEVCGGIDEDCDNLVDDEDPSVDTTVGGLTGWFDADDDGLGDRFVPVGSCALGAWVVANDQDCDDGDRAIGADWWLRDLDRDGVGAGAPVMGTTCTAPPGHANAALVDCDDADSRIHPGAPDSCGDGVDQDCTGLDRACRAPLSGFQDLDEAAGTAGGSIADFTVAPAGDLDGDGAQDLALFAGRQLTISWGPVPELQGPFVETTVLEVPASGAVPLLPIGDADDDGRGDLLVGAPEESLVYVVGGQRNTLAFRTVLSGAVGGELGAALAPSGLPPDGSGAPAALVAEAQAVTLARIPASGQVVTQVRWSTASVLGTALVGGGDLDGDGVPDFAAASPTQSGSSGLVFVVPLDAPGGNLDAASTAQITGEAGQQLGTALAFGDLTGDGLDDLVGAASLDDVQATNAGVVYAWSNPESVILGSSWAEFTIRGDGAGARLGTSLAAADLDGDGAPDLAIGATDVDVAGPESGAVYVFSGPVTGTLLASDADFLLRARAQDGVGRALGRADLDGDRTEDLLVSGAELWWWIPGI